MYFCMSAIAKTWLHTHTDNVCYNNNIIGIVPITCEELFNGIEAKKGTEAEYQVVLNMLEIYNEQVHWQLLRILNFKVVAMCWLHNNIM